MSRSLPPGILRDVAAPTPGLSRRSAHVASNAALDALLRRCLQAGPSPDIRRALEDLGPASDVHPAWGPELGSAIQALRAGRREMAAVSALLAAHNAGRCGAWTIRLGAPIPLFIGGHHLAPSQTLSVDADGDALTVVTEGGSLRLLWRGGAWRLDGLHDPRGALGHLGPRHVDEAPIPGLRIETWLEPSPEPGRYFANWPGSRCDDPELAGDAARTVGAASHILRAECAEYIGWIAPMLRGFAATRENAVFRMETASGLSHAGLATVTFPFPTLIFGEVLVHETSHQYLFLLELLAPLVEDGHPAMAYSPLRREMRPISRVLGALHASLNMWRYWDHVAGGASDDGMAAEIAARYARYNDQMLDSIGAAGALTDTGQAFFDEIARRSLAPALPV